MESWSVLSRRETPARNLDSLSRDRHLPARVANWTTPASRSAELILGVRGGLEQLHGIARRVLQQDLPATWSSNDLVAEFDASLLEGVDITFQVAALHDDSIPSAWLGAAPIWHRL